MIARLGFGKVALAVSLAAHAGVTLIATLHARPARNAPAPLSEVSALDLLPIEPESEPPDPDSARRAPRAAVHDHAARTPARGSPGPSIATDPVATAVDPVLAPGVIATPVPAAPRFTMLVAATSSPASGSATLGDHAAAASAEAPAPESAVEVTAKLRSGTPPAYTARALAAGVESEVPLEIVVDPAGVVRSARTLGHVGYGLDEAALQSVQSYRFTPAERLGHAVAVRMRWLMRFQLD